MSSSIRGRHNNGKRRRMQSEYDVHATIDSLSSAVMEALYEYGDFVAVVAKDAAEDVAEQCRQEIAANSPRSAGDGGKNGHYADTWKKVEKYRSATESRWMVYNSKHYQLTHLLEHGHEKWTWGYYTGGIVPAKPHIRPAEAHAEENLINTIKRNLS